MAITNDQFVGKMVEIQLVRKHLAALSEERHTAELALNEEYKVDECNKKKNTLAIEYTNASRILREQIEQINKDINLLLEN